MLEKRKGIEDVLFVLVNMGNGNSKYRGDKKGSDDESGGDLNHDCIGFYKLKYVCKKKFERICDIEMKIGACDQRSDGWLDWIAREACGCGNESS